jgi:hypothetical protein
VVQKEIDRGTAFLIRLGPLPCRLETRFPHRAVSSGKSSVGP